jgi:hypothetical protein
MMLIHDLQSDWRRWTRRERLMAVVLGFLLVLGLSAVALLSH